MNGGHMWSATAVCLSKWTLLTDICPNVQAETAPMQDLYTDTHTKTHPSPSCLCVDRRLQRPFKVAAERQRHSVCWQTDCVRDRGWVNYACTLSQHSTLALTHHYTVHKLHEKGNCLFSLFSALLFLLPLIRLSATQDHRCSFSNWWNRFKAFQRWKFSMWTQANGAKCLKGFKRFSTTKVEWVMKNYWIVIGSTAV